MIEEEFDDLDGDEVEVEYVAIDPADKDFIERLKNMSTVEEENRARVLRSGLDDYDLEDDDFELIESELDFSDGPVYLPALPLDHRADGAAEGGVLVLGCFLSSDQIMFAAI